MSLISHSQFKFDGSFGTLVFNEVSNLAGSAQSVRLGSQSKANGTKDGGLACSIGPNDNIQMRFWTEFKRLKSPGGKEVKMKKESKDKETFD